MTLEEIKDCSIDAIEERVAEIRGLNLESMQTEEIAAINQELDALEERKKALKTNEETRQAFLNKIAKGEEETKEVAQPQGEERKMELNIENYMESTEYRTGWLKNLQGKEMNAEERTAFALAGAEPVIPTTISDSILKKVKEVAPILDEITLLHVNGAVKFAVEGVNNDAEVHAENTKISPAADTLVEVALSTFEVVKLIQISASVKSMAIDSFETWLVDMLSESIANKLEALIFNGTGSAQAKGINTISWTSANSVDYTTKPTAENVFAVLGLLKDGYVRNAKAFVRRKTLQSMLMPLQDKAKNNLVMHEGGKYYIDGIEVEFTASVAEGEMIVGAPSKYVGNLSADIEVKKQYDIDTNSYKYLGVANFDGQPAIEEAFVKLKAAA